MNIYEHWTRITRFNPLWVSGLTSCSLGLSKQQHCTCIMLFFLHTLKPSNFAISVRREQKATTFVYFSEIRNSLLEFNSRKGRQSEGQTSLKLREFTLWVTFSAPSSRWLSTRTKSLQQPGTNFTSKANENEMEYEYDFSYLIRGLILLVSKCNWTTWNITGFTNFEKLYSYSNRLSSRHLVNTQFTHFEVSFQCTRFAENGLSNDRGVTVNKKNIHRLRLFDKKGLF